MSRTDPDTGPAPSNTTFWAGQRLDGQTIVFHVFSSAGSGRKGRDRLPLLAAARTDTTCVLIHVADLAGFLLEHSDCTFACPDAVALHELITGVLQAEPQNTAITAWWQAVRESRVHSCGTLAQLVDRARGTDPQRDYDWVSLAGQHCDGTVPSIDQIERDLLRMARNGGGQGDDDLLAGVHCVMDTVHSLYRQLSSEAASLVGVHNISDEVVHRYGPLAIGLEVQGVIAINHLNEYRQHVDTSRISDIREQLEGSLRDCEQFLRQDREVSRRFRVRNGRLISRDGRQANSEALLAKWIELHVDELTGPYGVPLPRPEGLEGGPSSRSDQWRTHRRCNTSIDAWCRMRSVSRNLGWLDNIEPEVPVDVTYEMDSRIESIPSQQRLEELVGAGLFVPADGHRFVMLRFVDLELRSLAACCATNGGGHLARVFQEEPDFVGFLVLQLDESPLRLASRYPVSEADVVRAALEAMSLRLGPAVASKLAKVSFGVRVGEGDMRQVFDRLGELYTDLKSYCEDDTIGVVAGKLHVEREKLAWPGESLPSPADLHRAIYGWRPNAVHDSIIERLRFVNRHPELFDLFERSASGSDALYDVLFGTPHCTPAGQIRGPELFSEACAPHLDLADDAVKAAIFEVVAAGYRLAAWFRGTIVVEIPSDRVCDLQRERLVELAKSGAERVLRCVSAEIECRLTEAW